MSFTASISHPPLHLERGGAPQLITSILDLLMGEANQLPLECDEVRKVQTRHWQVIRIARAIEKQLPLHLVILGFPAKSSNREKTIGNGPDLGEVLGLRYLNTLCERIEKIYSPGAKVTVCSDGHVFSSLVGVDDEHVDNYGLALQAIVKEFEYKNLAFFSLKDFYDDEDYDRMRSQLRQDFAESVEANKARLNRNEEGRAQFNGIHRFLFEDALSRKESESKNQIRNRAKEKAYEVIRHSDAFSKLVEFQFSEALRLSIHPQAVHSWKIGVKLVPGRERWATPWHNVVLEENGNYQLVPRVEAKRLGAAMKFFKGKYAYFSL